MNFNFEKWVKKLNKLLMNPDYRNQMSKKGYSPLNFDVDSKIQAIDMAIKLSNFFEKRGYEVYWRRSSSGRGFHFTIMKDGKQAYFLVGKALFFREKFGDCRGRLRCDKLRNKYSKLGTGILFNIKNGKFSGEWKRLELDKFIKMVQEDIKKDYKRITINDFVR